jgi:FdhD protein
VKPVGIQPDPVGAGLGEELCERFSVTRISRQGRREEEREIVREVPLTIFVNGREIVTLLTVQKDFDVLALGFLYCEGWIRDRSVIDDVRVDVDAGAVRVELREAPILAERFVGKRLVSSSCGRATSFYNVVDSIHCRPVVSDFRLPWARILIWMEEMLRSAVLYRRTRCTHSVALYGEQGRVYLEEDIGRHNGLDRVVGRCLLEDRSAGRCALLLTGRLSSEVVIKAARLGVPILVSRSAPTSLALRLGDQLSITLVAYVRGGAMNVYTHGWRILDGE